MRIVLLLLAAVFLEAAYSTEVDELRPEQEVAFADVAQQLADVQNGKSALKKAARLEKMQARDRKAPGQVAPLQELKLFGKGRHDAGLRTKAVLRSKKIKQKAWMKKTHWLLKQASNMETGKYTKATSKAAWLKRMHVLLKRIWFQKSGAKKAGLKKQAGFKAWPSKKIFQERSGAKKSGKKEHRKFGFGEWLLKNIWQIGDKQKSATPIWSESSGAKKSGYKPGEGKPLAWLSKQLWRLTKKIWRNKSGAKKSGKKEHTKKSVFKQMPSKKL